MRKDFRSTELQMQSTGVFHTNKTIMNKLEQHCGELSGDQSSWLVATLRLNCANSGWVPVARARTVGHQEIRQLSSGRASPVPKVKLARAGLNMVTFWSWMVDARTSFFAVRIPAWNRSGLTLRSGGSNNTLLPVLF